METNKLQNSTTNGCLSHSYNTENNLDNNCENTIHPSLADMRKERGRGVEVTQFWYHAISWVVSDNKDLLIIRLQKSY